MKILFNIFIFIVILTSILAFSVWWYLGSVTSEPKEEMFVVAEDAGSLEAISDLAQKKFIKNGTAFFLLFNFFGGDKEIMPGGYMLAHDLNAWEVLNKITSKPDLLWLTIRGCLRREQIGEMIGKKLGWDEQNLESWNNAYKNLGEEYFEGVYYPDTYLVPVSETGAQVAKRFINRFNEKFAPLSQQFQDKNIRWVTALKIASLIEREAAGLEDMKLISGIIWNRLDIGMKLQIDATMQYTRGSSISFEYSGQDPVSGLRTWWGNINLAEKTSDSPYNTYVHKGLPPTPICSPGIDSIEAVLKPEETDCLFYLHDIGHQIHCAKTYAEHKENIEKYLK